MNNSLLISESPLTVLPSLVRAIGLSRAVIVQQLYWRLTNHHTHEIDGERYISDTYADWCKNSFPFWTPNALRKYFTELEKDGIIISLQRNDYDRTKFYRLNHDKLRSYEILAKKFPQASESDDPMGPKAPHGSGENGRIEAAKSAPCLKEERGFKDREREPGRSTPLGIPVNAEKHANLDAFLDTARDAYGTLSLPNERRWLQAAIDADAAGLSPAEFGAALRQRINDPSRKYNVTPEQVVALALETRARASTPAEPDIPQWKKDRDACPLCDADGLVWDGGLSSVCGHGGQA